MLRYAAETVDKRNQRKYLIYYTHASLKFATEKGQWFQGGYLNLYNASILNAATVTDCQENQKKNFRRCSWDGSPMVSGSLFKFEHAPKYKCCSGDRLPTVLGRLNKFRLLDYAKELI